MNLIVDLVMLFHSLFFYNSFVVKEKSQNS